MDIHLYIYMIFLWQGKLRREKSSATASVYAYSRASPRESPLAFPPFLLSVRSFANEERTSLIANPDFKLYRENLEQCPAALPGEIKERRAHICVCIY